MKTRQEQTTIELDEDLKIISFTKRIVKIECVHRKVVIDEDKNTITCTDCKHELNPIQWVLGHLDKINSALGHANSKLAEVRVIEEKLQKKNSFMCKHCHEPNTIDFHRLPSKAAIARKLSVIEQEGDEYRIEDGRS